jgi:glycosyltransferase involved in cell wall biosynthesis
MLVLAGKISSAREESELATALWDYSMAADTVSLGFVPDEDLKALYAESSVFLFPSLYEGFGLPCLEAMAAGLPVVCSDTSSMPEVVGSEGLFFDPLNVDAGAELVSRLLADSELWQRQSVTGFERAHQFTWQRTGELTSQAYGYAASLLAGGRTQLNSGASCSLAQAEERGVFRV